MCGRYAFILPPEAMAELFKVLNELVYPPRYNLAPTQPIAVVREGGGGRRADLMRWGLVPGWVKEPAKFKLVINARADGLLDKPAFRTAIRYHRCIVPASGYYEWMVGNDGRKLPFYITHADGAPLAFAGLYATWEGPNGEEMDTAAIVTTETGPDTAGIHDRMPAILEGEQIDMWLDTRHVKAEQAQAMIHPLPEASLAYRRVNNKVGNHLNEGPELLDPPTLEDDTPHRPARLKKAASGQLDLF